MTLRVATDIGGTFTDLVGYQDGAILTAKTLTVLADPIVGAASALRTSSESAARFRGALQSVCDSELPAWKVCC